MSERPGVAPRAGRIGGPSHHEGSTIQARRGIGSGAPLLASGSIRLTPALDSAPLPQLASATPLP